MLIYFVTNQLSFFGEQIRGVRQLQASNLSNVAAWVVVEPTTRGAPDPNFQIRPDPDPCRILKNRIRPDPDPDPVLRG